MLPRDTADIEMAAGLLLQVLKRSHLKLGWHNVMTDLESALIKFARYESNNCNAHTARILGLGRTTLVEKLRKRGLITREAGKYPDSSEIAEALGLKFIDPMTAPTK